MQNSTQPTPNSPKMASEIEAKYQAERAKRLRSEGMSQFTDLFSIDKYTKFIADPWEEESATQYKSAPTPERTEVLIIGAGFGGLLYAARLIDSGFAPEDIHLVDNAGGFGGTWYWNRYPGLMCDIESYIYMPLLEEMGYMPTQKYVSGNELRAYSKQVAEKWNIADKASFHCKVQKLVWDDKKKEWMVNMTRQRRGKDISRFTMRARFVMMAVGIMVIPQIAKIKGLEKFTGETFHTARWDYNCTGGSSADPALTKLRGKRVGIIGTGATAIQVVPAVSSWAKELYVFQRTPSSVDVRGNCDTDKEWWDREIRGRSGWQQERRENFNAFITNLANKPERDMVSDGWTGMPAYSALVGTEDEIRPEDMEKYARSLHTLDLPRQEKIRARVDQLITDKETAQNLKAWYPSWCKRACFHDEYLQAFNKENVTLVDTNGRGVELINERGIIFNDKEYPLDVLILGTGYRSPFLFSPGGRVDIDVRGRGDCSLDAKWKDKLATLHGIMSHDFPNLFWPGFSQASGSPNFVYCIDMSVKHAVDILAEARKRVKPGPQPSSGYKYNVVVEPTIEAEEEWSARVVSQAGVFAATAGCTPSYINAEGEMDRSVPVEELKRRARGAMWGKGIFDFERVITEWKTTGGFQGVDFMAVE